MHCPKCGADQSDEHLECPQCGLIFSKYKSPPSPISLSEPKKLTTNPSAALDHPGFFALLKDLLLFVEPPTHPFYFSGRVLVLLTVTVWGWIFITTPLETNYAGESFFHNINLPFHEAGHVIFSPFGRFLYTLGGSLGQLLMPLICMITFLVKTRDTFGASIATWWLAESLMDLSPYINDARALDLILVGGVTGKEVEDYHDWEWILRHLGWLPYDHTIAHIVQRLGIGLMLLALFWGGLVLWKQQQFMRQ